MKVIDLCSGLGGWTSAFIDDSKWEVIRYDNNPKFEGVPFTKIVNVMDIEKIDADLVLASPPCNTMSMASVSHHWRVYDGVRTPYSQQCKDAVKLFHHVKELAEQAKWYVIENPIGMGKYVLGQPSVLTYFCIWNRPDGDRLPPKKPTWLWYRLPVHVNWPVPRKGSWELAPRGSKTGTQGINGSALRALIPYGLSKFIKMHVEADMK